MSKVRTRAGEMNTTDIPLQLKRYYGHNFNFGTWTSDTGLNEEAKLFLRRYRDYLKKLWSGTYEIDVRKEYYYLYATVKSVDGKFVYISISDIRYWQDEWATSILIRTMKDENDHSGGPNHYTNISRLKEDVINLMERGVLTSIGGR